MTTPQLVLSIIYFIVALALVAIVMLQSGKRAGLARMTKWVAIVFMVLTLVICLL